MELRISGWPDRLAACGGMDAATACSNKPAKLTRLHILVILLLVAHVLRSWLMCWVWQAANSRADRSKADCAAATACHTLQQKRFKSNHRQYFILNDALR
jgi:hypothetical protein